MSVPAVGAVVRGADRDAAGLVVDAVGGAGRGGGDDRAVGLGDRVAHLAAAHLLDRLEHLRRSRGARRRSRGGTRRSRPCRSSTRRVTARSVGSMPLGGRSEAAEVSGGTSDFTSTAMCGSCYRATVTSAPHEPTAPRRIHVSAAVILDDDGRLLVVRKAGTTAFMQPGGKPEPGESASETLSRELDEELGIRLDPVTCAHSDRSPRPRRTSRASSSSPMSSRPTSAPSFRRSAPRSPSCGGSRERMPSSSRSPRSRGSTSSRAESRAPAGVVCWTGPLRSPAAEGGPP